MSDKPYLPDVKLQYESFPYPPRNPADEARRLIYPVLGSLLVINHHCFRGRRDFRTGFRCLVAGGGTGDTTIYLAEQLRGYAAEIVYLDMSDASRPVAEERARVRGLTNISWVSASILELPRLALGEFDYIECGGVLHHLESTEGGLAALNSVLKDEGAIGLMLYGRYGRRSIYDMQALLRQYLPPGLDMPEKIRMARQLLAALPGSNSFIRDLTFYEAEIAPGGGGDAGLYDLLLHSQDRCFDVPGLYALAQSAGLHLLGFAVRAEAYDPLNHIGDKAARKHLPVLPLPRRQSLAEQMVSDIRKHEFFLARQPNRGASLKDDELALRSYGSLLAGAAAVAAEIVPSPGRALHYSDSVYSLDIPCTAVTKLVFASMDGTASLKSLRKRACRTIPGMTPRLFDQELAALYGQLHPRGYLYLLEPGSYGLSIPDYARLNRRREQPATATPASDC